MEVGDEEWVRQIFNINRPVDWTFLIGARGTSSQLPDAEKWCTLDEASYLYFTEFMSSYHGAPSGHRWEWWMKYGLVAHADTPALMCPFAQVVAVYGRERIDKILSRSVPRYIEYRAPQKPADPYPDAVPMPGAGQSTPTIKDVKGERLS